MTDRERDGARLFSPQGLFSLRVSNEWRWEQTSEDGSYVFHRPKGHGVVRFAESMQSAELDCVASRGEPCRVGAWDARHEERVAADASGRPRRTRQWAVADGRIVVWVTHEGPSAVDAEEDAEVEALLGTIQLHRDPHPTVAALLQSLHDDPTVHFGWSWQPRAPLAIRCAEASLEIGLEPLVRALAVSAARRDTCLADEVRRIRHLEMFHAGCPPFEAMRDDVLPLVRGGVLQETVDERMRSIESGTFGEPHLVCGRDLARRLFAPGLYVYYGVDVPGAFHFITPALAAQWGCAQQQLDALALHNLRRKIGEQRLNFVSAWPDRMLVLEDGEGFAASRLLLGSFRATLARRLGVPYRVALPSAGVLVAFSGHFDGWKQQLGEDVWDAYLHEPVVLTQQIYENNGDDVFMPVFA